MSLIRKGLQRASGGKKKGGKKGETKEEKDPCSASRTVENGKQRASEKIELDDELSKPVPLLIPIEENNTIATKSDSVSQSTSSTSPGANSSKQCQTTKNLNETGCRTVENGAKAAHSAVLVDGRPGVSENTLLVDQSSVPTESNMDLLMPIPISDAENNTTATESDRMNQTYSKQCQTTGSLNKTYSASRTVENGKRRASENTELDDELSKAATKSDSVSQSTSSTSPGAHSSKQCQTTKNLNETDICMKLKARIQAVNHVQEVTELCFNKFKEDLPALERVLIQFVLPYGTLFKELLPGSIILVVQATSVDALKELWNNYIGGQLKATLQKYLGTDDVKALVGSQDISLDLEIEKNHFDCALKKLQELQADVALQHVLNNPNLMDELARCLDRQFFAIKYWRHLAYDLDVPPNVSRQFEMHYADLSPTLKLFEYLKVTQPRLTVRELKEALKKDYRNDIIKSLEQICQDEAYVADQVTDNPELLDRVALELDTGKKPIGNWRSLAAKLRLPKNRIDHFEMYSSQNPTAKLFDYLSIVQPSLKVQTLKKHLCSLERKDAVEFLTEKELRDDDLVKKVIVRDSQVSIALEDLLNKSRASIAGIRNWRNLAHKLDVPLYLYDTWDPKNAWHSPTKQLLKWLCTYKEDFKVYDLAKALRKIERNDAVVILEKFSLDLPEPSKPGRDDTDGTMDNQGIVMHAFKGASPLRSSATPPQEATTQDTVLSTAPPGTPEERRALQVSLIPPPLKRAVHRKLDIRRMFYDDFRMLGEKCGIDRDSIEYLGQRGEPTKEIMRKWTGRVGYRANVSAFIEILKTMERIDVAEMLEKWVESGVHRR